MRAFIFTCTRRPGGLDVTEWALRNLSGHRSEIVWVIGDELYQDRKNLIKEINDRNTFSVTGFDTSVFRIGRPELYRTVAHAYNYAIEMARAMECELFISLQDYIVPPSDGIARFEGMAEGFPEAIFSGLCSFSSKPSPDEIANPAGMYSVFETPFDGLPDGYGISWADVRENSGVEYSARPPVEWEANWSAIPKIPLENTDLQYNGDYDLGVAYENQGYSFLAEQMGYPTMIDMRNHAISLDHKAFFPRDEELDAPKSNLDFHNRLWSGN